MIDVAYRVQGIRLAETPQPKNLIGGSMQGKNCDTIRGTTQNTMMMMFYLSNLGELDLYPVKETPNSPRSNESKRD